MNRIYLKIILFFLSIVVLIGGLIYLNQESFIFYPTKYAPEKSFVYQRHFKEVNLKSFDQKNINNLYFEVDKPKGVVYFLHGNSGNLSTWGNIADFYLDNNYNVFITDYRGYGKSEGKIFSQEQLFRDAQLGYDYLKKYFDESQIIVVGYSIGTGIASYLASTNNPKILILQAPYFNLREEMNSRMPFLPEFLLKYPLENNTYIPAIKCPVYIFHGTKDQVISYTHSYKLKNLLKEKDNYFSIANQGHIGINDHFTFQKNISAILRDSL